MKHLQEGSEKNASKPKDVVKAQDRIWEGGILAMII